MNLPEGKVAFSTNADQAPSALAIYGQELNERTWRMAKMNLAIHAISSAGLGERWADTFARVTTGPKSKA